MRTNRRITLLALTAFAASASVRADTLPAGAQPVSGYLEGPVTRTPLPIKIPNGWVFVLTDYESSSQGVMVFSAEDPEHPTFRSNASYNRSFQTGLVFSTPPLISVSGVLNSFFCFSGYLLPEQ